MFRNALFSALVLMVATTAFAANKEAPHERAVAPHEVNARAADTGNAIKGAAVIEAIVNDSSATHRDAAVRAQDISNNKQAFGLTGDASTGFDNFQTRLGELKGQNKSSDQALDQALAERGVSKEEFLEKCKPL